MQVRDEAVDVVSSSGMSVHISALTATGAAEREQFLHIGQIVVATPGRIAQVPSKLLCTSTPQPICSDKGSTCGLPVVVNLVQPL